MGEVLLSPKGLHSKIILRNISLADAKQLALLDKDCNQIPWSAKLFRQEIKAEYSEVIGAYLDDFIVGFIIFHKLIDAAHIVSFGVASKFRRCGLGRSLLATALEIMVREGLSWVSLEVRASNKAARKLYDHTGFNEVGVREKYYSDNSEDALVLKASVLDAVERIGGGDVSI
ncbi:MAG: ribosomal protein S18-alanine N-acetyltransferase [Bdellovibrionales bacterium]|nr:ribosomal protein S18-alanine N-acetyltransferase [Bdellovibrionales bacterium]